MNLYFRHVDELPRPLPSNLALIDSKAVLESIAAPLASENSDEETLLKDIINGLAPSGGRSSTSEVCLPGREEPWRRVTVCALPTECSRHNSPAQPHAIADCARSLNGTGDITIIMCLADPTHAFAAGCAVARAFPVYSCMSRKRPAGTSSMASPVSREITVYLRVPKKDWSAVHGDIVATAEGIVLAARLVDTPPNFLHTSAFVQEAMQVAIDLKGSGVTTKVIRGQELSDQGFGGIYGVGKAAVEPPALVVLSHPGRPRDTATTGTDGTFKPSLAGSVCFVGKGIVYDSGGLSIKGKTAMPGMKRDMGGAAAVLAAFQAAVKAGGSGRAVHAILCLAENSVDATATRPDDVHVLYSGKTVEINNTDAEGRLVLGDGVAYACRHLEPSVIIDAATLTGAQGIATGQRHAAIISNDEGLEKLAASCGRSTGDLVHPLVYCPEFFAEEFRSSIADMKNSVANRSNAQVSCAAQFIANHMEAFIAGPKAGRGLWLHVDMAFPVHQGERATGFGVALLFGILRELDNGAVG